MVHRVWLVCVIAVFVIAGCRSTPRPSLVPVATPTPRSGDSVGEAYRLIVQRSVGQVNPSAVAVAGVQGLRLALLADGVVPPDVPGPGFSADLVQDLNL